jgi:hypothetical protein
MEIKLSNGKVALIDECDAYLAELGPWHMESHGYAVRNSARTAAEKRKPEFMHRVIMAKQRSHGMQIDHINGNRLDNRRCNLRMVNKCGNTQNARMRSDNTSGVKGVSKQGEKWTARVQSNGKRVFVGIFTTKEEAEKAVRSRREELHGPFANHC